jgi:hypothetical protein
VAFSVDPSLSPSAGFWPSAASCAVVRATKRRLTALGRAAALHLRTDWLQARRLLPRCDAHEHLLDDAPVERVGGYHRLERRQRDLAGGRAHARAWDRDLANLQGRGLRTDRSLLVILDGSKALRQAVRATFGDAALVQRCQVCQNVSVIV